ncbi:uncharacterized protein [Periplaneta americana]|uniref:uncharacterized protein isoform X4 n=1 Tax=Periplaneta americana TaxID=6978 RepID=UPI0037E93D5E
MKLTQWIIMFSCDETMNEFSFELRWLQDDEPHGAVPHARLPPQAAGAGTVLRVRGAVRVQHGLLLDDDRQVDRGGRRLRGLPHDLRHRDLGRNHRQPVAQNSAPGGQPSRRSAVRDGRRHVAGEGE